MAVASGIAVANTWYSQPMLADMAHTLHCGARQISLVATATQIGYGVGMPVFLPLADLMERRRLVVSLFLAVGCALMGAALAQNLTTLVLTSFFIGLTTVIAQVLIPAATELASPVAQGRVVGTIMTGVLLGILLARTVSGFVSQHLGWRAMFWIAAALAWFFAGMLRWRLPLMPVLVRTSYRQLIGSIFTLVRDFPELWQISLIAAMFFAPFSAFWTTLVFLLGTPPYHFGSQVAGLFGLVGATGALIAPAAGHLSDRRGSGYVITLSTFGVLLSFAIFWMFGFHLWGLVAGVILLDAAVQAAQVSNQSAVFALQPTARGRLNTVYMLCYFGGAAIGSYAGSWAWSGWGWPGVCGMGIGLTCIPAAVLLFGKPYRSRKT
jgi:predicted MFS family arabinose efflux permease